MPEAADRRSVPSFPRGMSPLSRGVAVVAGAAVAAALAVAAISVPAWSLPRFARETGLPCGRCHINPAGGGPRTAFGKAFAANGYRLPGYRRHRRRHHGDHGSGMMGGYGHGGMMGGYGHGMMGGYGGGMMGQDW